MNTGENNGSLSYESWSKYRLYYLRKMQSF